MQVDLVGGRRQVVRGLRVAVGERDDGLAGLLEATHRRGDLLQLGEPAVGELAEVEDQRGDPLVVLGVADRVDDVAQERLRLGLPEQRVAGAPDRIARELLDQGAARRDDERGLVGELRRVVAADGEQRRDDQADKQQVDERAPTPCALGSASMTSLGSLEPEASC